MDNIPKIIDNIECKVVGDFPVLSSQRDTYLNELKTVSNINLLIIHNDYINHFCNLSNFVIFN